ncbi:MAG: hypothetical protein HYW89_01665 [Candidatus Sungiibacteriota bacterium]|uniref:Uncharacterized protein n=1 Tax=Candidatus Sungiibacteriota bacterium TaxID=2750080 RepID=A0A7T5UQY9_9BACT|nr:MAG: hypothetical protein HYW89_01665 [Candidatus Sungbacteria bacterium]
MKPLIKFLDAIRRLPEEVRRALAITSTVAAALIIFWAWRAAVVSRLERPEEFRMVRETPISTEKNVSSEPDVLAPSAGLVETFQSLEKFIVPKQGTDQKSMGSKRNILASISSGLEKAWRYVYDPLK